MTDAPSRGAARHTRANVPCVCGALKYTFGFEQKNWRCANTNIRILSPLKASGKGGMRICFDVEELEENGTRTLCIAKMFMKNISNVVAGDYFGEGEAQCMCEEFATNFNNATFVGMDRPRVSFLQCQVVQIPRKNIPQEHRGATSGFFSFPTADTNEVMFILEPKLRGHYTKYNNNFGGTFEDDDSFTTPSELARRRGMFCLAEAFSHFTLVESRGSMLVCDLQGVHDFFTDPQIHTEDGKGLGMGNMGWEGIRQFAQRHKCNNVCRALSMRPLLGSNAQSGEETSERNIYALLRNPLHEEQLLLSKPIEEMTEDERLEYAIKRSQVFR